MNVVLTRLRNLTTTILNPATSFLDLRNASEKLSELFYEVSGFDNELKENSLSIFTPSGNAVGPVMAAFCIKDIARTRTFLQGINEAIMDCLHNKPANPVKILYAGTGPFATLLTTLATLYTPQQLQMVLLEINPSSIDYLNKTISDLQLQSYVIDVIQTDAAVYSIPTEYQPDILLVEAMNSGLAKEPQLAIVSNLLAQCNNHPLLIPTTVTVDVCLVGSLLKHPVDILKLETLLELDLTTAILAKIKPNALPVLKEGIIVTIPMQSDFTYSQLAITTRVRVYKNHEIGFNESGITLPIKIKDLHQPAYPSELVFRYESGKSPGFRYEEKKN